MGVAAEERHFFRAEKLREVAVQGYHGTIVQLSTEAPLRENPPAQQPIPSKGKCRFGEEDGYSEGEFLLNLLLDAIGNHCWPKQQ